MINARARKILFDTFWTSKGWTDRDARSIAPDDRAFAMAHGMMFEPLTTTHDALLADLRRAVDAVSLDVAAGHFLASLSSRRLDLRSGLASRVLGAAIEPHAAEKSSMNCATCTAYLEYVDHDLDVLQFERHKWGGVRRCDPVYLWFDLTQLAKEPPSAPTDADRAIFARVLEAVASAPPKETPTKLSRRLKDALPSSKEERDELLDVLAAAGVLRASDPSRGCGEFSVAGAWRGGDGCDRAAVSRLFGSHGVSP